MYELVVGGCAERTLRLRLDDLVNSWSADASGHVTLGLVDQARLVTVIDRLHALGIVIEHVEHRADATVRETST